MNKPRTDLIEQVAMQLQEWSGGNYDWLQISNGGRRRWRMKARILIALICGYYGIKSKISNITLPKLDTEE